MQQKLSHVFNVPTLPMQDEAEEFVEAVQVEEETADGREVHGPQRKT